MSDLNQWLRTFLQTVTHAIALVTLLLLLDQAIATVTEAEPVFRVRIERNR